MSGPSLGARLTRTPLLLLCVCACVVRGVQRSQMFEFGPAAGDELLEPGTDVTRSLPLDRNLFYYDDEFDTVYINTNGLVGVAEPTPEAEYLGKLPSSFRMVAALLGDLDTSDGRGRVYFRQDSSPKVLQRAAQHISQAFPNDDNVDPVHAVVVTWENVAPSGGSSRGDGLDRKRNTFQLVIASMESASYAITLYPEDGMQYLSTAAGGDTQRPLEAGFVQGQVKGWFGWNNPGEYYRTTTEEEESVRQLTENTNSGRRGVWVYEIGTSPYFVEITPGEVTDPAQDGGEGPRATERPRQTDGGQQEGAFPAYDTATPTVDYEQEVEFTTEDPEYPDIETPPPRRYPPDTHPRYPEPERPRYPEPERPRYPEPERPRYPEPERPRYPEPERPRYPEPEQPRYPEPERPRYSVPEPVRPLRPQNPQIVVVDEDLDVDVFSYNFETCAKNRHRCSPSADCRDYSDGFCCHCRPGFYGNGKDCVADGIPQRMNGKVNGRLFLGASETALELVNNDLHSYAVPNDGRAYVAISSIPDALGPSLLPLFSLGGVIGWAFALEQPGAQNGFSLIGGEFSRQAEVLFQPGGERVTITQDFQGIDEHGHLAVSTRLEGRLPEVPQGATVQVDPYQEIYQYGSNLITSSSSRHFTVSLSDGGVERRSYQWRQSITYRGCSHADSPAPPPAAAQQLSVDHVFVFHDVENRLIRFATSNKIGSVQGGTPEQNPCFTGTHGCDNNAVCRTGNGLQFSCECTSGFTGDGRVCYDVDECVDTQVCASNAVCNNQPGTFRCQCNHGYQFSPDGKTCVVDDRPVDHCARGSHTCDLPERALCSYTGASDYICSCLPGFLGDGRACVDMDECQQSRCHGDAVCLNTPGSFSCQCRPGYHGDGFQCTELREEKTPCQLDRDRATQASSSSTGTFLSFFRPRPAVGRYVPQCDGHGAYTPTQCHHGAGQCWCVDASGREVPGTRQTGGGPLCIDHGVAPPAVGPTPRPDVSPVAAGTHLLFAQSGKIEHLPLDGNHMMKDQATPLLHVPDRVVIAVAYDCVDHMVYWTDITGPAISRARMDGGDAAPVVTADLQSPEGVAIDHLARLLFWTDSMRDTVEVSRLDGSQRRVLFNTDLVNPRAIVTDPTYGRLYWTDWNRDGPKIEMSSMDGSDRSVLVKDDLALPNGLTYDPDTQQLCWADAGTHKVECVDPARRERRQIAEGVQYPFSVVAYGRYLYYTDWRREAVVALDRQTGRETDEFLPQKRSRVYGITATPTTCHQGYNYCANNGGCSHLCLPRPGGFTCRCPDAPIGRCVDANL